MLRVVRFPFFLSLARTRAPSFFCSSNARGRSCSRSFPLRFARVLSPFLSSYYSRFPLARTSALPFHLPPFLIPLQPYNLRHTFSFIHVGTPHVRPQLQLPSNLSYRDLRLPRVLQRLSKDIRRTGRAAFLPATRYPLFVCIFVGR